MSLGTGGALNLSLYNKLAFVIGTELPRDDESFLVIESNVAPWEWDVVLVEDVCRLELVEHYVATRQLEQGLMKGE